MSGSYDIHVSRAKKLLSLNIIYVVKLIKAYKLIRKLDLKKVIFSLTKHEKRNYHSFRISCRVTRHFSLV